MLGRQKSRQVLISLVDQGVNGNLGTNILNHFPPSPVEAEVNGNPGVNNHIHKPLSTPGREVCGSRGVSNLSLKLQQLPMPAISLVGMEVNGRHGTNDLPNPSSSHQWLASPAETEGSGSRGESGSSPAVSCCRRVSRVGELAFW